MKKQFFRLPENMSPQARSAFQIAVAIAVAHFVAVPYYLYLVYLEPTTASTQFQALAAITVALGVLIGIGSVLSRRGQPTLGIILVLGVLAVSYPPIAILVSGLGTVLGIALMFVGPMSAFQVLPRKSAWVMTVLTITSGLATLLIDIFGSAARPSLPGIFIQFLAVSVVVVLGYFILRLAWDKITHSISNRLAALVLVVTIPLLIGITTYISFRAGSEIESQALHNLEQNNQSLATNVSTWLELHVRTIQEMAMLPDITSMDAALQRPTLLAIASTHPNLFLVNTVGLNGINVARNDDSEPKDYHDRAWFLGAKGGAPITFEALISRTTNKPALNMSTPIYNKSGKIVGVASIVSELSEISKEVLSNEDRQGITYIVDAKNHVVAHPDPSYTEAELRDLSAYPPVAALSEGKTGQITFTDENGITWVAYVDRLDNGWGIIAQQREAELLAPVRQFQTVSILLILLGSGVMFALAWFAIRRSLQPIGALTTTVSAIAAGDLSRVAEVKNQDEIGVLASTFNDMTAKLRESFATLEQRVAERTRNLELAAQVGRTVSQVRALDIMLKEAAELIRTQFDLYYVQVYLTDPSQTNLILQSGTGTVGTELLGRAHRLPLNIASINGRAAIEKKSVVISDTASSPAFRPNPLLPDTRSEMAVPLMIGDRVVGVLDMQSEHAGSLSQDVLPAFEALAGQLAIAIQNATFLAETEKARAEVESQARRQTRANWVDYLDAIHQPEETGFVFEQNKIAPMTRAEQSQININALTAPIEVTGEALGNLVVEMEGLSPIARVDELVNTVARQVAQQIESLRLLDSAERYRAEAEQVSRRNTREGWKEYTDANAAAGLSYVYDLKEVRPFNQARDQLTEKLAYSLPLKVRDETIGQLVVQGLGSDDSESIGLANAVAERLGAHIESLRLSKQTEQALATTQKQAQREQALRQITSAVRSSTDPATILRSAARELGTLLGRKTVVRLTTTREAQDEQAHRPADLVGEAGNESVSPAEALNADGGKE